MEKHVILSIRGVQYGQTDHEETMELVTQGTLDGDREHGYVLSYAESRLTGLEGTTTTFRIDPDKIVLRREGTLNSEMIFEEGQQHFSLYETPYGGLMLGVRTRKARATLDSSGGSLEIRYALEVDNEKVGENSFEIRIREPEHRPCPPVS